MVNKVNKHKRTRKQRGGGWYEDWVPQWWNNSSWGSWFSNKTNAVEDSLTNVTNTVSTGFTNTFDKTKELFGGPTKDQESPIKQEEIIQDQDATIGNQDATIGNQDATIGNQDATIGNQDAIIQEQGEIIQDQDAENMGPYQNAGRRVKRGKKTRRMKGGKGGLGLTYYATPVNGLKVAEPTYWEVYGNGNIMKAGSKKRRNKRNKRSKKRSNRKR